MKKLFGFLLLSIFFSIYAKAACNSAMSESHIQNCESHTVDVENHDATCCSMPSPVANYRFDACAWDGTAGEVQDSSENHHAVAENNLTTDAGLTNNSAHFDGVDDYIDVGDNLDPGATDQWSVSLWFKSDTTDGEQIIFNKENLYEAAVIDGYFKYAWKPHWNWDGETSFPVVTNTWYHVVITYDGVNQIVYKDGDEVYRRPQTGDMGSNNKSFLIGARESDNPRSFFDGNIDELKIFKTALAANQVQTIYDNENLGQDYNGTNRDAIVCSIPSPVAEYRLDECKYDGTIQDSSGNGNNLTSNTGTTSTWTGQIERAAQFNGTYGRIYGKWKQAQEFGRKVTLTAWIKTTNPKGDNYARIVQFANYRDKVETRTALEYTDTGVIRGFIRNGNRKASISYDLQANGKHDGQWHFLAFTYDNGAMKLYVDDEVKSANNNMGDIHRGIVLSIGGRQSGGSDSYKGAIDEVKIFDKALVPAHILAIYNNEKIGKDYGGDDVRSPVICSQAIFNAVNRNGGCFNWNNNITTKVAGENINLTILTADENDNNSSLKDVNITKLEMLSFTDVGCSTLYNTTEIWSGNEKVNACFNPTAFTHNKAIKCAKIQITGIFEGESVESNSSDTFSIRPERFTITPDLTGKLISEHAYTFQVQAKNYQSETLTADFNQSLTTPTSTLRFREGSDNNGSLEGFFSLTPNNLSFSNGLTSEGNLSFNNVGLVTLDINDTTWAEVDSDDTPEIDRTIHLEQNLTFIPDHFDIAFTSPIMINHLDGNFTYLSNDLNMSAWLNNLSTVISARGEKGGLMSNYETPQSLFYANNIDITTSLVVKDNPVMTTAPLSKNNALLSFIDGKADINYSDVRFNYPRDFKVPSAPIMIDGSDANLSIQVTDIVDTSVTGENNTLFAGDTTFYYAKLVTEDVKTGENSVSSESLVEIYSSAALVGFERITSSWYINKEDSFSEILGLMAKESRNISSSTSAHTTAHNLTVANKGHISYDLVNTHDNSYKAFYHFNIQSWLWHSKYNDYNATSNCSEHPCFEYIYESENANMTGIQSGHLNSSSFANDFNNSTKRKAIKLLR